MTPDGASAPLDADDLLPPLAALRAPATVAAPRSASR